MLQESRLRKLGSVKWLTGSSFDYLIGGGIKGWKFGKPGPKVIIFPDGWHRKVFPNNFPPTAPLWEWKKIPKISIIQKFIWDVVGQSTSLSLGPCSQGRAGRVRTASSSHGRTPSVTERGAQPAPATLWATGHFVSYMLFGKSLNPLRSFHLWKGGNGGNLCRVRLWELLCSTSSMSS